MFGNMFFPANTAMKKAVKQYNKYSLLRTKVINLENANNTILNLIDDNMYEEAIRSLEKRRSDIDCAIELIKKINTK